VATARNSKVVAVVPMAALEVIAAWGGRFSAEGAAVQATSIHAGLAPPRASGEMNAGHAVRVGPADGDGESSFSPADPGVRVEEEVASLPRPDHRRSAVLEPAVGGETLAELDPVIGAGRWRRRRPRLPETRFVWSWA
jgi:hypothetical protein